MTGGAGRVVLLSSAVAAVLGALLAARAGLAGTYGTGPFSFPHQPHLSAETVAAALAPGVAKPGSDRECRVCHDYTKSDTAHLEGCAQCHVSDKHLAVKRADPATPSAYPHKQHLKDPSITCFTCHKVRKEMGWTEFTNPEGGLGVLGPNGGPGGKNGESTCTDCHRAHEPKGGRVKLDEVTGDGKRCETCHAGAASILPLKHRTASGVAAPAGTDRPFLHADHGGADANCDTCHAKVRGSTTIWDYDPTAGTADACRACHVDAAGKSLVGVTTPPRRTKLPFVAFDRFPHDKHLGPGEGKIQTSGKVTDGCRTCHFPEKDAAAWRLFPGRKVSPEPVGRNALVDYDGCLPCHATWKVAGHGVGAWACFKCHSGKAGPDGKLPMASATVERESLAGGVQFARHHHPGVARDGAPLADASQPGGKTCADCHLGDVRALTSRLQGRAFLHDPHLPDAPTSKDCLGCHTTSATTSWSADLGRFDPHFDAPVTGADVAGGARGCLACHAGATRDQLAPQRAARTVPEFDHKAHVTTAKWKDAVGVPCTECHGTGGTVGYTTPQDVADCTRCHAHDEKQPEKFARTGKKSSTPEEAKACAYCHDDLQRMAAGGTRAERTHLSLLPGVQHHDKGGDCASCHAREGRPYAYQERITSAKIATSIHEDASLAKEWFNDPRIVKPGADPQNRTCMTCHRTEPRGYLRALTPR